MPQPDDPSPQKLPITDPNHLVDMGVTRGLLLALQAIKDIDMADRLTGVGVARYAVQAVESEHRVWLLQKNIRLALQHGIDLDKNNLLWEGRKEVIVQPKDLVEQANGN
jgi:hypothetical protein